MKYLDLINIRYKFFKVFFCLLILFLLIFIYILRKDFSNVYNTYGYVNNKMIFLNLDINHANILNNIEYVRVNDEVVTTSISYIGELSFDQENLVNYQVVGLSLNKEYIENQVVKLAIYYDKEKVWKKLKKIIWR